MKGGGTLGRAFEIFSAFAGFGLWLAFQRLGFGRAPSAAPRFARLLEDLGTSFVKLGQHLSLRSDLFPPEFIEQLQKLQDQVKLFPAEEAIAAVERAFGEPPARLFERFDSQPLAAASVAQVHTARTFDGREVVVKILRPGVALQVERDMRILLAVARLAARFSAFLTRYKAPDVVREVAASLRKELDLREEARNARRFADAFRGSETVGIPDVILELCAETVMV